jgi:hypothetical protein
MLLVCDQRNGKVLFRLWRRTFLFEGEVKKMTVNIGTVLDTLHAKSDDKQTAIFAWSN